MQARHKRPSQDKARRAQAQANVNESQADVNASESQANITSCGDSKAARNLASYAAFVVQ